MNENTILLFLSGLDFVYLVVFLSVLFYEVWCLEIIIVKNNVISNGGSITYTIMNENIVWLPNQKFIHNIQVLVIRQQYVFLLCFFFKLNFWLNFSTTFSERAEHHQTMFHFLWLWLDFITLLTSIVEVFTCFLSLSLTKKWVNCHSVMWNPIKKNNKNVWYVFGRRKSDLI